MFEESNVFITKLVIESKKLSVHDSMVRQWLNHDQTDDVINI